ncbi:MAG: TAXI family TRAP transporter solute-binding subunit [Alphaproteobacteria bacterium]
MTRRVRKIAVTSLAVAVAVGALALDRIAVAQDTFVTIGTGGVTGVYYPTGGAIQRLVNRGRADHGIRVLVESTGGSVFNLNAIARGEIDMGVVQSDWQYHAYNGGHERFPEANLELRALFSVHGEPFTILARADSGIATVEDLVGKRVNIGNPGSGQRGTMEVLMDAVGWTMDSFSEVFELPSSEQSQALCDNNFDAMVFTVGHPSGSIQEATTTCETVLVPARNAVIDSLVDGNDYYAYSTISGGMYQGNPDDVVTFGVKATFVTSTAVSDDVAYEVVKAVFENFDDFKRLHPAFGMLQKEEMITNALSAPLHDGAIRYYREAGLM